MARVELDIERHFNLETEYKLLKYQDCIFFSPLQSHAVNMTAI